MTDIGDLVSQRAQEIEATLPQDVWIPMRVKTLGGHVTVMHVYESQERAIKRCEDSQGEKLVWRGTRESLLSEEVVFKRDGTEVYFAIVKTSLHKD